MAQRKPLLRHAREVRMKGRDQVNDQTEQITERLIAWNNGDTAAIDDVIGAVYKELRRMADRYLRLERPNHTLQPTALVHEAYLRLVDQPQRNH